MWQSYEVVVFIHFDLSFLHGKVTSSVAGILVELTILACNVTRIVTLELHLGQGFIGLVQTLEYWFLDDQFSRVCLYKLLQILQGLPRTLITEALCMFLFISSRLDWLECIVDWSSVQGRTSNDHGLTGINGLCSSKVSDSLLLKIFLSPCKETAKRPSHNKVKSGHVFVVLYAFSTPAFYRKYSRKVKRRTKLYDDNYVGNLLS